MSAFIVDPRTIDYLVAWVIKRQRSRCMTACVADTTSNGEPWECPEAWHGVCDGPYLYYGNLRPDEIGGILMAENVRSVRHRYPATEYDGLPGPVDQHRIGKYRYRHVDPAKVRPDWVVKSGRCLHYQSSETPDWNTTLAAAILGDIIEDATTAMIESAPWEITDDDL